MNAKEAKKLLKKCGKLYVKKRTFVKAVKMDQDFVIETSSGALTGNRGDYLVEDEDGNCYLVEREIFETVYREAKESKVV